MLYLCMVAGRSGGGSCPKAQQCLMLQHCSALLTCPATWVPGCPVQEVDPGGFCEPEYHLGITLVNRK